MRVKWFGEGELGHGDLLITTKCNSSSVRASMLNVVCVRKTTALNVGDQGLCRVGAPVGNERVGGDEWREGTDSISEILSWVQNFTSSYFIVEAQEQLP